MAYTDDDVKAALRLLRPQPCPVRLIRVGGMWDGAYLVPDDLDGVVACFSPGVNNTKFFEDQLAVDHGIRSHLCDFTSDVEHFQTPMITGMQTFEKKWLAPGGEPDSITLDEWVAAREPVGDLLLQMDIEGAEYANLLSCSRETLRRFRIIVIEIHGVNAAANVDWYCTAVGGLIHRLSDDFVVVHARANNCCGETLHPASGMNLPGPLELTLLRRDRFEGIAPGQFIPPSIPHPEDIRRNVPGLPPLFLNDAWSDWPLSPASRRKIHEDRLDYLQLQLQELQESIAYEEHLARVAASQHARDLSELAAGRPFRLTSGFDSFPDHGVVEGHRPFFFHTGFGVREGITVDLGARCRIEGVEIENRTDACWDRIAGLSVSFHDTAQPDLTNALPLVLSPQVLVGAAPPQYTVVEPVTAQYVTLFSPAETALHLAALRVFGKREPG